MKTNNSNDVNKIRNDKHNAMNILQRHHALERKKKTRIFKKSESS